MPDDFSDIHDALGIKSLDDVGPLPAAKFFGELTGVNDLARAVQSGRPENMLYAAGMLGLGAVAPEARAGKALSAARELDAKFNLLTGKYQSWLEKEGLPKISMDEHDPSKLTPAQQSTLSLFQDKWNGLLSKQMTKTAEDTVGPAEPVVGTDPLGEPFPSKVPFGVPPKAQALGFNQPAAHGTRGVEWWEGGKDVLKLPEEQLGVHFGNPQQAQGFALPFGRATMNYNYLTPRTYPVVLQMQKPLEMADMGSWGLDEIKTALAQIHRGEHFDIMPMAKGQYKSLAPEAKGQFPMNELDKIEDIRDMRDYIASKGYDSIRYTNTVEDPGKPSYILFRESPTQRGYVIGARSPFAQFDPSKLHLPSLAATGAGILAYPLDRSGREEQ